jgi:hypothetical protein
MRSIELVEEKNWALLDIKISKAGYQIKQSCRYMNNHPFLNVNRLILHAPWIALTFPFKPVNTHYLLSYKPDVSII